MAASSLYEASHETVNTDTTLPSNAHQSFMFNTNPSEPQLCQIVLLPHGGFILGTWEAP